MALPTCLNACEVHNSPFLDPVSRHKPVLHVWIALHEVVNGLSIVALKDEASSARIRVSSGHQDLALLVKLLGEREMLWAMRAALLQDALHIVICVPSAPTPQDQQTQRVWH